MAGLDLAEQIEVPCAAVTEVEFRPDVDAGETPETSRKQGDELFAGQAAESEVERDHPGGVQAQTGKGSEALMQRLNQQGQAPRCHDGVGMSVKGHDDGHSPERGGMSLKISQDMLMAHVDTVEDTDGNAHRLPGGGQPGGLGGDSHWDSGR